MIKYNNKGITLIALVITIIVLLVIAGITITGAITGVDKSTNQKLETELKMVQHAVFERYTKYSLTKDTSLLVGTEVEKTEFPTDVTLQYANEEEYNNFDPEKKYYEISSSDFSKLGISNLEDTYIVNYKTGEVYNKTSKKSSGENLYIYSVENK